MIGQLALYCKMNARKALLQFWFWHDNDFEDLIFQIFKASVVLKVAGEFMEVFKSSASLVGYPGSIQMVKLALEVLFKLISRLFCRLYTYRFFVWSRALIYTRLITESSLYLISLDAPYFIIIKIKMVSFKITHYKIINIDFIVDVGSWTHAIENLRP